MSTGKRWTVSFAKVLLSIRQSVERNTAAAVRQLQSPPL
jgi:hypothetical protein